MGPPQSGSMSWTPDSHSSADRAFDILGLGGGGGALKPLPSGAEIDTVFEETDQDLSSALSVWLTAILFFPVRLMLWAFSNGSRIKSTTLLFRQRAASTDHVAHFRVPRLALRLFTVDSLCVFTTSFATYDVLEESSTSCTPPDAVLRARRLLAVARHSNQGSSTVQLLSLADVLVRHHDQSGDKENIDEAVRLYGEVFEMLDEFDSQRAEVTCSLGRAVHRRFREHALYSDLDEAILLLTRASDICGEAHPQRTRCLNELGLAVGTRYERFGASEDLDQAIDLHRRAVYSSSSGNDGHKEVLKGLGTALLRRGMAKGDTADLTSSVPMLKEYCSFSDLEVHDRDKALNNLGVALNTLYDLTKDANVLDECIATHRSCLDIRVVGHPLRFRSLENLSNAYMSRHVLSGEETDVQLSVSLALEGLQCCKESHPGRATALSVAANCLRGRYEQLGQFSDLLKARQLLQEAVAITPKTHSKRFCHVHNLGITIQLIFRATGNADDMADALRMLTEARELCEASGDPFHAMVLIALGRTYRVRFEFYGDKHDLEQAISVQRLSFKKQANTELGLHLCYINLADTLCIRFDDSGDMDDLEEAINLLHEAVRHCANTPSWHRAAPSLSDALLSRYSCTGLEVDYERATEIIVETLDFHRHVKDYPERYRLLRTSAKAHQLKFLRSGSEESLSSAIEILLDTLQYCAGEHGERHFVLQDLAQAYAARFALSGSLCDCESALERQLEALGRLKIGHAERSRCLIRISRLYLNRAAPYFDALVGITYLRDGVSDNHGSSQVRLTETSDVLNKLDLSVWPDEFDDKLRSTLLEVHQGCVALFPRVAYFGLDAQTRLRALRQGASIATDGAAHAVQLGRYSLALEMLEEGRAVFWSHALRGRAPFEGVPDQLREQLLGITRQLERDSYGTTAFTQGLSKEEQTARRRQQSEQFERLLGEVRNLPGFERFLLHDAFESLVKVATNGPVVVLLASKICCQALVLRGDAVLDRVPLYDINLGRLQKLGSSMKECSYNARSDLSQRSMVTVRPKPHDVEDILQELWTSVVGPVFALLKLNRNTGRDRPRLWWCPTGPFAFLPIHAAGVYTDGGDCCSNYVVSSYVPTLGTLLNAQRASKPMPRSEARMLLGAVPRPYRGANLPCTVTEIGEIKSVVPASTLIPLPTIDNVLIGSACGLSAGTLLDKLPEATILHLACHGHQDAVDPLESGFLMRDDILTVSKLLPVPLPRAFLAVLSACETAKGDQSHPDQAIHLAATMLFAGFKSVVATLWSMNDIDGPVVAKTIYTQLFADDLEHLDPDTIPYALDDAVQNLRNSGLPPSRWAPYVHLGV